MQPPSPIYLPTDELVAVAFLRDLPALADVPVATTLAAPEGEAVPSWQTTGKRVYIQVTTAPLGPPPDPYFPSHRPRLVISCWALPKRWNDAGQIAQVIRAATYDTSLVNRTLLPADGYNPVYLMALEALAEPARITGDPNELARYDISLSLEWISLASSL